MDLRRIRTSESDITNKWLFPKSNVPVILTDGKNQIIFTFAFENYKCIKTLRVRLHWMMAVGKITSQIANFWLGSLDTFVYWVCNCRNRFVRTDPCTIQIAFKYFISFGQIMYLRPEHGVYHYRQRLIKLRSPPPRVKNYQTLEISLWHYQSEENIRYIVSINALTPDVVF